MNKVLIMISLAFLAACAPEDDSRARLAEIEYETGPDRSWELISNAVLWDAGCSHVPSDHPWDNGRKISCTDRGTLEDAYDQSAAVTAYRERIGRFLWNRPRVNRKTQDGLLTLMKESHSDVSVHSYVYLTNIRETKSYLSLHFYLFVLRLHPRDWIVYFDRKNEIAFVEARDEASFIDADAKIKDWLWRHGDSKSTDWKDRRLLRMLNSYKRTNR